MPPHAVPGAPPPSTAYQSPGGDVKRTPLNPQAPAFVPGAGIGFRPGSTATFAHGRVQLPSHAFPPQQQAETASSPVTALSYAEAAPAAAKEVSPTVVRTETWAAKVKKAVAAEVPPASPIGAPEPAEVASSPVGKEVPTISSPKQVVKPKAAPKTAKTKAGAKARAAKPSAVTTTDVPKSTPKAGAKASATKPPIKSGKISEKGAQREPVTSSPTAHEKSTPAASPAAKAVMKPSELDEKRIEKKREDKDKETLSTVRNESSVSKTVARGVEKSTSKKADGVFENHDDAATERQAAKASSLVATAEAGKTEMTISVADNKVSGKSVSDKIPEKINKAPREKSAHKVEEATPATSPVAAKPEAKERYVDKVLASVLSESEQASAQSANQPPVEPCANEDNKGERAKEDFAAKTSVAAVETAVQDSSSVISEQTDPKPIAKEISTPENGISEHVVVKREGLHSARPSASSRVSALLGHADDDDVTRYQPLSSRTPFGLKPGGLKQKLQFVVAGLGTYGSGGLDKLDAETKKEPTLSGLGNLGGDRSAVLPRTEQSIAPTLSASNDGDSMAGATTSTPSFTYTLSPNGVKVYKLQDMLSIRHLPQCNKSHKPTSPSALFGMRNTVIGSSSAIFDIPSALGHKQRGLDRMLEEGSSSNWNLRATKDELFRSSQHGNANNATDMSWIRRPATEVPEVPKDSWQATQAAAKVKSDRNVKLQRKLKAQLNKMTPATYEDIFKAIMDLGIQSIEEAQLCVNLVFEKAITNHQYIDMYAKLCFDLQKRLESDGVFNPASGSDFRRMLVQCCQTAFENNLSKPFVPPEGAAEEETFEALLLYKKKMKGNLVFVSALSMQHLVGTRVLLAILTKLIDNKDSVQLEALAAFLPTVANSLEASKLKDSFEDMFTKIRALSQDPEVEHRIRCLLLDCVEQRDKELRRNEHQQFRKVQSHAGGGGFHSVLPKTRTYQ